MPIWYRKNGGNWNGNPSADPATGVGGFSLGVLPPVIPFVSNADAWTTVNFGASAFAFAVPSGFTAGWPASGGGFTTLDPATIQGIGGGGGTLSLDQLTYQGSSFTGGVTAYLADAKSSGAYYWEFEVTHGTLFTTNAGSGPMVVGAGYSFFIGSAAFGAGNANGGSLYNSGSILLNHSALYVNGVNEFPNFDQLTGAVWYSVAVQLEGSPPAGRKNMMAQIF